MTDSREPDTGPLRDGWVASDNNAFLMLGRIVERRVLRRLLHDLGFEPELADRPEMCVPRCNGENGCGSPDR